MERERERERERGRESVCVREKGERVRVRANEICKEVRQRQPYFRSYLQLKPVLGLSFGPK